jgi:hypothetical protein
MSMTHAGMRHATKTRSLKEGEQVFTLAYYYGTAHIETVEIVAHTRSAVARQYARRNRMYLGRKRMTGRGCWFKVTERKTGLPGGWVWVS